MRAALAGLAALLAACSPLERAERLEKAGRLSEAAEAFEEAARSARAEEAPKELLEAGRLWARLGDCGRAVPVFEDAAKLFGEPWRSKAKAELLVCPDYIPLVAGSTWTVGDSETGGANMRQEFKTLSAAPDGTGEVEVRIYAGRKLFSTTRRSVRKADWRIEESDKAGAPTVVLRYPFQAGTTWEALRGDKKVRFTIDSATETVKVAAGRYSGCLRVKEQIEGMGSWTYTYYAAGVGRVLTTVAGKGYENRNAELIKPPKT